MIIRDLDVVSIAAAPDETYPPLVIHSNTELTRAFPLELLESVRGWDPQGIESGGSSDDFEFARGDPLDLLWKSTRKLPLKYSFCLTIAERLDHSDTDTNAAR